MEDSLTRALHSIIKDAVAAALEEQNGRRPQNPVSVERLTLLTEDQVSDWLQVPVMTLRDWRKEEINIPFIPLSGRKVRYDEDAVIAYLKSLETWPS